MKLKPPARGGHGRCASGPAAQAQTLRWAAQNDILTLDPHSQNHATTNAILMHAYEGLTRYNASTRSSRRWPPSGPRSAPRRCASNCARASSSTTARPSPPTTWSSPSAASAAAGHDGIYVTGISEIKKIDDHTVDFILSAPNPLLLRNIIDFRIMSKVWSEKNRTANVQDYKAKEENFAVAQRDGHRPLRITGWTPEQRITMTINNDWWDKHTNNVKEVVYTPIKSDPTRVAALLSGDVDMLTDLPTQDVARCAATASSRSWTAPRCAPSSWRPTWAAPS
jgi:peptide/nickel transport system substrate-binding protein